ncbi:UNVERIFIED_CONTAM: cytochrome c-type biogenesis protein CcmF [Acetivibrio alkalicellulosi]
MGILGNIALLISLISGIFSVIFLIIFKKYKIGIKLGFLSSIFIAISSIILLYLLIVGDFSIEYVFRNTDQALPLIYKISAFWSGSAGSLLLWATCISMVYIFIYLIFRIKKIQNNQYLMCLTSTTTIFNLVFLVVLIFINRPFKVVGAFSDGFGLTPSLQSIGMVFHPPLIMISYSLLFATFASNLYEILYPSSQKLSITKNIALLGWIILTAGIVSGGLWAYTELGWGGYWGWDPIENSALVTWLIVTAYLHLLFFKKNDISTNRLLFILISSTVFSIIFGTFLARSGILRSVHSYSNHGSKIFFSIILIVLIVVILSIFIMVFRKRKTLNLSTTTFKKLQLYIPIFLFIVPAIIIIIMTISPLFTSEGGAIPEKYYNLAFGIPGLLILISSTASFSLKGISTKVKVFIISFSLILGLATMFLPAFTFYSILVRISLAVCVMCLAAMFINFGLNFKNIFNNNSYLSVFVIHLSIIIIAIGIIGSKGMSIETRNVINENEIIQIGNYDLKLMSVSIDDSPEITSWISTFSIYNDQTTKDVDAAFRFYKKRSIYHSKAFILSSFKEDLYIIVVNVSDDGTVHTKVSLIKWINFLWIGFLLMILASLGRLKITSTLH